VQTETGIGQDGVTFAFAVRLGVGTEFELKTHICRFRSWCRRGFRTVLLAVTLPPPL
jgi:hypothetical protein